MVIHKNNNNKKKTLTITTAAGKKRGEERGFFPKADSPLRQRSIKAAVSRINFHSSWHRVVFNGGRADGGPTAAFG